MNDRPDKRMIVQTELLTKVYRRGREEVRALQEITLAVARGEFIALVGPSGSGKTTLLSLIGCMDVPSSGTLLLDGKPVHGMSEREQTQLRRTHIGFVFQHFCLLPSLTVAENVLLPALFARRAAGGRAAELLARVGLTDRARHRPNQLSGGEMQRAAIARALINQPKILLADEPTGNLDSDNARAILDIFRELNRQGLTLIMVTHNLELARLASRVVALKDGRLAGEARGSAADRPVSEANSELLRRAS